MWLETPDESCRHLKTQSKTARGNFIMHSSPSGQKRCDVARVFNLPEAFRMKDKVRITVTRTIDFNIFLKNLARCLDTPRRPTKRASLRRMNPICNKSN